MNIRKEKQEVRIEKREKENKKIVLLALLLLLFSISMGGIYGYWVGNVDNPTKKDVNEGTELTIGEANHVTTTLEVSGALQSQGKKLVPANKALLSVGGAEKNVEFYETTYDVAWKDTSNTVAPGDQITRKLKVTKAEGKIGGTANSLLNVEVTPTTTDITANGDVVKVKVKVTLTEPNNKAEYDAVINKPITVDLTFAVEEN